jgi:hypothetical protein
MPCQQGISKIFKNFPTEAQTPVKLGRIKYVQTN